ncbi:hypothetical protein DAPPUDRAFT_329377 [Daphnia pulex]|uniref:CxC3 like cysteine cluster domain-containing protein n=1 Tax=Daphnia pulex TaxID=6669 RepID=E9HGE2_DAPPU|nr:hypothetical protein DAPPUDRAFT_329377 [Daphnia pulex]|eukprot:EFX69219.1 hypothetical protein DAPPUDRAFT_329377 [Daphnia pulex]
MKLIPNPDPNLQIAVVMHQGRFDLRAASFLCMDCRETTDADQNGYIFSGFWPARATTSISYLFCEELFAMWAFKEWELCRLNIKVKIKNMSTVTSPPCGKSPLMGSSDGNVKLKRHTSAGKVLNPQNERESIQEETLRFGDLVIKSNKDLIKGIFFFRHTQKKEMCGGSAYKAAKVDSCKRSKFDETGLLLSVCRHGIGLGAINMQEGESMKHILFLQKLVFGLNCKFFCNDVICGYEKFVRKVAIAFPEYQQMTSKMKGILPRIHAKAHHWPFQILYNPQWQKGAGLTVGEEHEQVFF